MSKNYTFWKMSYDMGCVAIEDLHDWVVKTETSPFGEITKEEYKLITGLDY